MCKDTLKDVVNYTRPWVPALIEELEKKELKEKASNWSEKFGNKK